MSLLDFRRVIGVISGSPNINLTCQRTRTMIGHTDPKKK